MGELPSYTKVFKALGDPRRARIVEMLAGGELCACDILERFALSQPTLSHHMKLLCESGLVRGREAGKWTYYSLNAEAIGRAIRYFETLTAGEEPDEKAATEAAPDGSKPKKHCCCKGCDHHE